MKLTVRRERTGVAPVIATLLMIAVAVAMSVIIFMWSQGFLSQTSSATGGQQGSQNQAAQSSIAIESATFTPSTTTFTVIVRNVGAVAVNLGSISVTGVASNVQFTGSVIATLGSGTWTVTSSDTGTNCWGGSSAPTTGTGSIAKGGAVTITMKAGTCTAGTSTFFTSGDVISFKITTNVGTFASAQFTVP